MKISFPFSLSVAFSVAAISASLFTQAQAQVSTLGFTGGAGTTSFDQYQGIAGGGWTTAWSTNSTFTSSGWTASVLNTNPLNGGGNYLNVSFVNSSGTAVGSRLQRSWNTGALSLTGGVRFEFDLRVLSVGLSSTTQAIGIQASSSSAQGATNVDQNTSWAISSAGNGWLAWNQTTNVFQPLNTGFVAADTAWHFTITTNAGNTAYTASVYNLASPGTVYTLADLPLRNTNTAGLSVMNFLGSVAANNSGGYAVDNISIVAVPEPAAASLVGLGGIVCALFVARKRRNA